MTSLFQASPPCAHVLTDATVPTVVDALSFDSKSTITSAHSQVSIPRPEKHHGVVKFRCRTLSGKIPVSNSSGSESAC